MLDGLFLSPEAVSERLCLSSETRLLTLWEELGSGDPVKGIRKWLPTFMSREGCGTKAREGAFGPLSLPWEPPVCDPVGGLEPSLSTLFSKTGHWGLSGSSPGAKRDRNLRAHVHPTCHWVLRDLCLKNKVMTFIQIQTDVCQRRRLTG